MGAWAHVVEQSLQPHALVVNDAPETQIVASRRKHVTACTIGIRHPHDLRGGVRVFEVPDLIELVRFVIQLDDAHRVGVLLFKATYCQPEALVCAHAPVHAVHQPWCGVCVNLFAFGHRLRRLRHRTWRCDGGPGSLRSWRENGFPAPGAARARAQRGRRVLFWCAPVSPRRLCALRAARARDLCGAAGHERWPSFFD
eukprot:scaffold7121_cov121-Isochrysis_galbana.AAC.8